MRGNFWQSLLQAITMKPSLEVASTSFHPGTVDFAHDLRAW